MRSIATNPWDVRFGSVIYFAITGTYSNWYRQGNWGIRVMGNFELILSGCLVGKSIKYTVNRKRPICSVECSFCMLLLLYCWNCRFKASYSFISKFEALSRSTFLFKPPLNVQLFPDSIKFQITKARNIDN